MRLDETGILPSICTGYSVRVPRWTIETGTGLTVAEKIFVLLLDNKMRERIDKCERTNPRNIGASLGTEIEADGWLGQPFWVNGYFGEGISTSWKPQEHTTGTPGNFLVTSPARIFLDAPGVLC